MISSASCTTSPHALFRARAVAAPQPWVAQFSPADGRARPRQPCCRHRVRRDRRVAGHRLFRPRCRARLRRLPAQLPVRAAERDHPPRRRCVHGRAGHVRGKCRNWHFQPFWVRIVLEERGDASNRLLVASHGRSADWRFLGASDAPRTGWHAARGACSAGAPPSTRRTTQGNPGQAMAPTPGGRPEMTPICYIQGRLAYSPIPLSR